MYNFDYEARHYCSLEAGVGSIIGGALGAGGSLFGGMNQASAATDAARIQAQAADRAAQMQWQMYQQNRADLTPYRGMGAATLNTLAGMYGVPFSGYGDTYSGFGIPTQEGSGISSDWWNTRGSLTTQLMDPWMRGSMNVMNYYAPGGQGQPLSLAQIGEGFKGDPSYSFARDEAMRQMQQQMAGRSGGGAIMAMGNRASGLASQNYNQYVQNYLNNYKNALAAGQLSLEGARIGGEQQLSTQQQEGQMFNQYFNRLASMAGIGQTATNQTGNLGSAAATNVGNATLGGAQATASGIVGAANAQSNMFGNLGAYGSQIAQSPYWNQSSYGTGSQWGDLGGPIGEVGADFYP
jgi:hypothetical protein